MLAYLQGDKFSLAVDAGYSARHVDEFYQALAERGLKPPDFTVLTHWHYDHAFGLHQISGMSIAHKKTNAFLLEQQTKARQAGYMDILKREDSCFAKEYQNENELKISLADMQFDKEIVLALGGLTVRIFHAESPHSQDTVCLYAQEEKILFLGDATSEDFFNNGYLDKAKLGRLVEMIEQTDCVYCVLSHAEPLLKADLLDYLYTIL